MTRQRTKRVWARTLRGEEKAAIAGRCKRFIREELKPRFLPRIRTDERLRPIS